MKVHRLEREQWLPAPMGRVFAFFADAANLETLTPPWLGFRIAHAVAVHSALAAIFDFRFARIRERFPRPREGEAEGTA